MTRFAALQQKDAAALVVYLTAGDGGAAATVEYVVAAARSGADLIELGVPWSDPSADGPVIEAAMGRALAAGMAPHTLQKTFAIVASIRARTNVPIVLFGYYNPLFQFGCARVIDAAKIAGIDGLLVVDLPADEDRELADAATAAGLSIINLIAPTTSLQRARHIAQAAGVGFIYYVSMTGVTGARDVDARGVNERIDALRGELGGVPIVTGFGIRRPEDVAQLAPHVDGVVVGSAIVKLLDDAREQSIEARCALLSDYVRALKTACKRA